MSASAGGTEPAPQKRSSLSPLWIVAIVVMLLVAWVSRLISEKPVDVTPRGSNLQTTGPNLLENSSFAHGLRGWFVYHNAQRMRVTVERGAVAIRPASVTNSVQEVYQRFKEPPTGTIIASGRVRVSGAPLPADASVIVMFVDSSDKGTTGFFVLPKNGTGTFPFAFAYTPNGSAQQFVLGVVMGTAASDRTVVAFDDLKVALAKTAPSP